MNPNESKMNPNESKMNPSENNIKFDIKTYTCSYCSKEYSTNSNLHKHLKNCKLKKLFDENKIELMEKEITELKENNKSLTINNQNLTNNITKINNQNNGTINYLNINFGNVQPMEQFIENLKTKYKLSEDDRRCLLNTYNECDIGLFSDTFS